MTRGRAPAAGEPEWSGITRLTTERGSRILVAWGLNAYQRFPGLLAPRHYGDGEWLRYTDVGPVEIGTPAVFVSAGQIAGHYVTSRIVVIEPVLPSRELSAAEIETVKFVGGCINGGVTPRSRFKP